jgi:hypothetical protein
VNYNLDLEKEGIDAFGKMTMRNQINAEEFTDEFVEKLIHKNIIHGDDRN